ncbi:MAG: hypothetical protein ABS862_07580 [Carnobacterium inhibens]
MKKLLASALLAGLMLGTTTQVFAATGGEGTTTTGTTEVTSTIVATYSVTIPANSAIDLTGDNKSMTGKVEIADLNTAGTVDVTATVTNLTLNGEATNDPQKQLSTTIAVDGDSDPSDQLSVFKLSNDDSLKTITVATDADSKDKFSGLYTGAVNFTFDYANPVDAEVPIAE